MNNSHTYSQFAPKGSNPSDADQTSYVYKSNRYEKEAFSSLLYVEELGVPYVKIDENFNVLKWNQDFLDLIDVTQAELIYERLDLLVDRSKLLEIVYDLAARALDVNVLEETSFEGKETVICLRALPLKRDGIVYILLEDRSIQKQFENLLTFHHQMEAVSHIAAGVAHELRNPLSVIKGFLQLSQLTNDFHKYYDTIIAELNRMNSIIEDFLSVSRRKAERKKQSPVTIMNSLTEIIKAECLLHDVKFSIYLIETPDMVHVNESIIKQIMLNLLRNSIEAFGKQNNNRTFTIHTSVEANHYIITIEDNGKGMPEEVLQQLGKPFFTTKETGTGIGIPLCKKMIEDHGGTFKIESTYNVGTKVTLSLPIINT